MRNPLPSERERAFRYAPAASFAEAVCADASHANGLTSVQDVGYGRALGLVRKSRNL